MARLGNLTILLSVFLMMGFKSEDPLCVLRQDRLPKTWGPPGRVHETLSQAVWSPADAADAQRAVQRGLDELMQFFNNHQDVAVALDTDTVESLIDPA